MRMEVRRASAGAIVVNDAYNANPDSMHAALVALVADRCRRRVAIVGMMAELDDPAAGHRADRRRGADELGIELIATGTDLYGITPTDDPIAALGTGR